MANLLLVSGDAALRRQWVQALGDSEATEQAVTQVPDIVPAVALLDLKGQPDTLIAEWHQACPETALIAMVVAPDADQGLRLLRAGAQGYCNRRMSPQLLQVAVQAVMAGEVWAGRLVLQRLLQEQVRQATPPLADNALEGLTSREQQIATAVAGGQASKVLADELGISERTIKAHLTAIYRKTGCRNRTQLALLVGADRPEPSTKVQ